MSQKILLFGGTGFLGSRFAAFFRKHGYTVETPRVEVRDFSSVKQAFEEYKPDIVFNATGKTGTPNVDWCETHQGDTYSVNVVGSINVATAAKKRGVYAVQLSSGCVYDGCGSNDGPEGCSDCGSNGGADGGKRGFTEEDKPNYFGSVYSRSRICCEMALKEFSVLQLRLRIPILGESCPKNLIDKLLRYPKMINKVNSCTVIEDFLPATLKLMEQKLTGVYNMTNPEPLDHRAIMDIYKEVVDPQHQCSFMSHDEEATLCQRRSNCVLSSAKREAAGAHMPKLSESLRRVLKHYDRPL
ncbi:sugar nucleotide-binding protein [Candidatus Peregrinibacteria bacterium]|nr:sugar nucleotide-binding protein [Candidatus Peregrinibacteria bacterium]